MPAASLPNVRAALLTTPRILVIEDRLAEQSLFQLGSIQGGCTFSHRRGVGYRLEKISEPVLVSPGA